MDNWLIQIKETNVFSSSSVSLVWAEPLFAFSQDMEMCVHSSVLWMSKHECDWWIKQGRGDFTNKQQKTKLTNYGEPITKLFCKKEMKWPAALPPVQPRLIKKLSVWPKLCSIPPKSQPNLDHSFYSRGLKIQIQISTGWPEQKWSFLFLEHIHQGPRRTNF